MKYGIEHQEKSQDGLPGGFWKAFGEVFTMPKTRAGLSLAQPPVACVAAALVFWVNLQTFPYLYPSNISGRLRHPCVHLVGLFFYFIFFVKRHRINAEM